MRKVIPQVRRKMKASELIKLLKEKIEVDGDVEVTYKCGDSWEDRCEIMEVLTQDDIFVIR